MTQVYYDQMPSPIGPLFLVADDEGLREVRFELEDQMIAAIYTIFFPINLFL